MRRRSASCARSATSSRGSSSPPSTGTSSSRSTGPVGSATSPATAEGLVEIALSVNGRDVVRDVAPQELLLDFLRDSLGLTGAKRSCDVQVCGACTVLVDGLPVSACCTLAADAADREVLTVEGFAELPEFARYEDAFTRHAAVQCGFCTSGLLLTIKALLDS